LPGQGEKDETPGFSALLIKMKIISKSCKETLSIGKALARNIKAGDIICLFGDLGSGKTVLTKGIACGLGGSISKVISPTFTLLNQYSDARLKVYHFDLYRLGTVRQILDLGFEEYFYGQGVSIIEWANKLKSLLPKEYLEVKLSVKGQDSRLLEFCAHGSHYLKLFDKIRTSITQTGS
jgi:tRNA threonylcarbamoyladenosine biosynthesis protein TsaE